MSNMVHPEVFGADFVSFELASALEVPQSSLGFNTVALGGDRYVTVIEKDAAKHNVVVGEVTKSHSPALEPKPWPQVMPASGPNQIPTFRRPIRADSAMACPWAEGVLALKADNAIQVFNLVQKALLDKKDLPTPPVYWRWLSPSLIGIVTGAPKWEVLHWNLTTKSLDPVYSLVGNQGTAPEMNIVNYITDNTFTWHAVVGLRVVDGRVAGALKLYSTEKKVVQSIDSSAASFAVDAAGKLHILLSGQTPSGAKLLMIELATAAHPGGGKKIVSIDVPETDDYPTHIEVLNVAGTQVAFVLTKKGALHLYEFPSSRFIWKGRVTASTVFFTAPTADGRGLVALDISGKLNHIAINEAVIRQILGGGQAAPAPVAAAPVAAQGSPSTPVRAASAASIASPVAPASPSGQRHSMTVTPVPLAPGNPADELALRAIGEALQTSGVRHTPALHRSFELLARTNTAHAAIKACLAEQINPGWAKMIAGLIPAKPEAAIALAQTLCDLGATVGIEKAVVFDAFMSANVPTALTTVALYVLREDKPDDAEIQTKVIEYNIAKGYANVAESIVSSGLFSQFNKNRVAVAFFKAGYPDAAKVLDPSVGAPVSVPVLQPAVYSPSNPIATPVPATSILPDPSALTQAKIIVGFGRHGDVSRLAELARAGIVAPTEYEAKLQAIGKAQGALATADQLATMNACFSGQKQWIDWFKLPGHEQLSPYVWFELINRRDPQAVSAAVKAAMQLDLSLDVLETLEILMLPSCPLRQNKSLQNLFLLTAIKARKDAVSDMVRALDNYDAGPIAEQCKTAGLMREAIYLFEKAGMAAPAQELRSQYNFRQFDPN